jgi:hypothetical protein
LVAVGAAPAAAALPTCTSFQIITWDGSNARVPSVGFNGTAQCLLRRGNRNEGVRTLQYLIACNDWAILPDGRHVERDGVFGSITETGLRLVQADKHIRVDGVYGPETRDHTSWPIFSGTGHFISCT